MLTNGLIPCNGRFPTLISLISLFLVVSAGIVGSVFSALILAGLILLAILFTLLCSRLLSRTVLKGEPTAFTLELPPYRRPRIGRVILRSILDRTLFVLGRAVAVAAPAGLLLWILANISVGGGSLLSAVASYLEPVGQFLGMDGVILLGFLLALPAAEIFLPVILMTYTGGGSLAEYGSLGELKEILLSYGWTVYTAICVILFLLFHFPCSTTLWTIKRESGKWRWMFLAALLPTLLGAILCILVSFAEKLLS